MKFLEKDLEDIIYEMSLTHEGCVALRKRGFYFSNWDFPFTRQLDLGRFGKPDLIQIAGLSCGGEKMLEVNICELKRGNTSMDTFDQSLKYIRGIDYVIDELGIRDQFSSIHYSLVMVGKSHDLSDNHVYLAHMLRNDHIYIKLLSYEFSIDKGLVFIPVGNFLPKGMANESLINNVKPLIDNSFFNVEVAMDKSFSSHKKSEIVKYN